MTEKKTRVSWKDMSEEEKRERKRILHREYMAKRRQQDPEFAKKQRELARKNMTEKRKDEEFNAKHREYCTEYNKKKKEINDIFYRFQKACKEYPKCKVSLMYGEVWIKTNEGFYISTNETTDKFVTKLNDIIKLFGNNENCKVDFDYEENEITVEKDGFPLFF